MSVIRGIWRILTTACEQSAQLTSESQDRPLSRAERLALWGHLLVCASCRRFRRQLILLSELSQQITREPSGNLQLSVAAKERIKSALHDARQHDV